MVEKKKKLWSGQFCKGYKYNPIDVRNLWDIHVDLVPKDFRTIHQLHMKLKF